MEDIQFTGKFFVVTSILFFILITPLFFIAFDFWAGTRKAKQRGERIVSDGWQRTVRKIARYYNALLALVVVDAMQMASIWYLQEFYGWGIPVFPAVTLLGAMGVAAIEVKSIYEKAEDKEKRELRQVTMLAAEIAKHRTNPDEIVEKLADFLNKNNNETK